VLEITMPARSGKVGRKEIPVEGRSASEQSKQAA
jgi:hypothetical protein